MTSGIDSLLILLILLNLILLGASRLHNAVRMVAAQGFVLGALPLLMQSGGAWKAALLLGIGSALLKGIVFPALLFRAMREIQVRREIEPLVGYASSLLIGVGGLVVCMVWGARLPFPWPVPSSLVVPVGLFTAWTGLFLIMARRKAITQVLGFIVLENSIFLLGLLLTDAMPLLVELGVLLDIFVAVFVMGIMVFHINREFDHINVDQLSALREDAS